MNIFIALIVANSRGCILLFFAGLVVFLAIKYRKNVKYLIASVCVLLVCFSGIMVFNSAFSNRIIKTVTNPKIDTGRGIIYDTSMNIIKDYPLTGIGKGNLIHKYEQYNTHKAENNRVFYHTHQIVLEMMVESGILGLIAFLAFIIGQIKSFVSGYKYTVNILSKYAAVMCLFITGLVFMYMQVENTYFALRKIYWIYIGLGYYVIAYGERERV